MPSFRKFHFSTALLIACLMTGFGMSSTPTWAASGFNCDVTIPLAVEWSDYFDQVGEGLFFDDDECGLSAPFDQKDNDFSDSSVAIQMDPTPHQSYVRFFVQGSQVEASSGDYVTVFRLADTRDNSGTPHSIAEIRLATNVFGGRVLQLVVKDDTGASTTHSLGLANPNGNIVHVEVRKSTLAMQETGYVTDDAFIAVDISNGMGTDFVVDSLEIWHRLPTEARIGVVGAEGSAGTLVFQPMELGQRFFSATPQN